MSDLAYDATRTALLVVDPYNDFISEGGKLYELTRETIDSQDCVTHMREVLAAARAAGLLVCYAPQSLASRGLRDLALRRPRSGVGRQESGGSRPTAGAAPSTPTSSPRRASSSQRSIGSPAALPTPTSISSSSATASSG